MRRRVQKRIQPILAKYQKQIDRQIQATLRGYAQMLQVRVSELTAAQRATALAQGIPAATYEAMFNDLQAALGPEIAAITTQRSMEIMAEVGVGFDIAIVSEEAIAWAESYNYNLVTGLTDTTRKLVSRSVSTYASTPGMTRGDLERLLAPAFGEARASAIAVTEVTRAYSEATNQNQEWLEAEGVTMRRVWETLRDDIVCPICGPLNGLPEEDWKMAFPTGPPAHPNCRCSTSLSGHDAAHHRADAEARATAREKILREKAREDGRL